MKFHASVSKHGALIDNASPLRVLHVSPSFYPAIAYGGPIFSTKAITDGIAKLPGFSVTVLSTDTSSPNTRERLTLPENPMQLPSGYEVQFCRSWAGTSISAGLLWRLFGAVLQADLVHLTGPYNFPVIPTLIACRLTRTPLVWSPRGGFQATAQWSDAPKRRAKDAFEKLCATLAPRRLVMHVTAPMEARTSARNFPNARCTLIPNSVELPELPPREWRPGGGLRLAFLSRIHPKKGLDILLPAVAELPETVTLDIYGDGDAAYVEEVQGNVKRLGLGARVTFHGSVSGETKKRAYTNADVFVLPTYSENFGIVVAEALAHGTPVVTTVNAPWGAIEAEGCGRWIPATTEELVAAIVALDDADLAAMGRRGRAWMARDFSTEALARQFAALYRELAGHA